MNEIKKETPTPKESTRKDYLKEVDTIIGTDQLIDGDPLKGVKVSAEDKQAIKEGAILVKDENSDRLVFASAKEYDEYMKRNEK